MIRFNVYKQRLVARVLSVAKLHSRSQSNRSVRTVTLRSSCQITRRHSYDLNFKLKIVAVAEAEAEAVNNNREITREYGISESMVRKWRNQQHVLFTGELKMTAKRASMGRYRPKDPELDQQLADWFSDQRSQGKNCSFYIYVSPLFKFKFSSKMLVMFCYVVLSLTPYFL